MVPLHSFRANQRQQFPYSRIGTACCPKVSAPEADYPGNMIKWNENLSTGHPVVDDDHKRLIASLNELDTALTQGAGREQVDKIIAFLNTYSREHFAREEAHMLKVGCPAYAENCREHRAFVEKLDAWVTKLNSGASISLVLEVYRETSTWIRGHIAKVDCKLRNCRAA